MKQEAEYLRLADMDPHLIHFLGSHRLVGNYLSELRCHRMIPGEGTIKLQISQFLINDYNIFLNCVIALCKDRLPDIQHHQYLVRGH